MEQEALDGLDNKEGVDFSKCQITIHDLLACIGSVEDLKCGYQLEEYICSERAAKGFLPNLKLLNGMDASITEMKERNEMRDAIDIMEKLPLVAGCYIMGQGVMAQPVWFLTDEVGSIISHSDNPNVKLMSFIHSPNKQANDPNQLEVSVMWPLKEIKVKHAFL